MTAADRVPSNSRFPIEPAGWLIDLNQRYEAMPDPRRIWVYPAVLLIAGAINMMLTIHYGFPFGLLFLLALLALVAVRAPYTAGRLRPPTAGGVAVLSGTSNPMPENAVTPAVETEHAPAAGNSDQRQDD